MSLNIIMINTINNKKFETANFKIAHNDLFNKFCTEIQYQEYKAIGGIDGLQAPKEQSDDE